MKNPWTEQLPVRLTDGEIRERGEELAAKLEKQAEVTIEAKAKATAYKDVINELGTQINALAWKVNQGKENRAVDCREEANFTNRMAETFRMDTGEVVRSRPLTPAEMQRDMFAEERKAKAGKPALVKGSAADVKAAAKKAKGEK